MTSIRTSTTTSLTADNIADLFAGAVALAKDGMRVSPRNSGTREVLGVSLHLIEPRARLLCAPPARILNPAYAAAETVWILSGSDAPWIFDYNSRLRQYADDGVLRGAYGPRLRNWAGKVDQLHRVVDVLKADRDSRRAVIQLYDPSRDAHGHKDVPCTLGFRFHLRDGRLHMSTTMRSQDVWTGMPYDVFTFTVLHELVAGWLGVEPGVYHHHVDSLHIYECDMDKADALSDVAASRLMSELATSWDGFDALLRRIVAGGAAGHRGWDAMATAMRGYLMWKRGEQAEARRLATVTGEPLGTALTTWYSELDRRRSARTPAAVGGR